MEMNRLVLLTLLALGCSGPSTTDGTLKPGDVRLIGVAVAGKTEAALDKMRAYEKDNNQEGRAELIETEQVAAILDARISVIRVVSPTRIEANVQSADVGTTGVWFLDLNEKSRVRVPPGE